MRITIIGQKWLAAELLQQCLRDGHQVTAVYAPNSADRLFQAAAAHGVPAQTALPAALPECDVILAAHAHVFIPKSLRDQARYGAVGYHPSLLPRHRGRDAVRWAVHMREPVTGGTLYRMDDGADTGGTLYRMDDGADTGGILLQDWCHIRATDTAQSLWQRELAPMGLRLFGQYLTRPDIPAVPQDETLATFEPAFTRQRLGGERRP